MLCTRPTLSTLFGALSLVGLSFAASAAGHSTDAGPNGIWLTEKGDARVQVSRCGTNLCGKVVWLKDPIDHATGKPAIDDQNQDPALRNRPVIGLQLFLGMRPTGPSSWSGRIYNADNGQTYDSTVAQGDPDHLQVRGCVGPLCGGETWTRVSR